MSEFKTYKTESEAFDKARKNKHIEHYTNLRISIKDIAEVLDGKTLYRELNNEAVAISFEYNKNIVRKEE